MAHYGRSPEEAVLRGEEHPWSSRALDPRPPGFGRTRAAVEERETPAAISARPGEITQVSQLASYIPPIVREGVRIGPGLQAKLDVGTKNLIRFTKSF